MRRGRTSSRALAAGLLVASAACTQGIPRGELPSEPIAFVRTDVKFGIATAQDFLGAISYGDEEHREQQEQRRTRTSIMLLTLPTGELRPVPDSSENALPFDWTGDGARLLIGRPDARRRTNELVLWNRLTGAFDRMPPGASAAGASVGEGPILAAAVGATSDETGARSGPWTVVVYTAARGLVPLPGAAGGTDPDVSPDGKSVVFARGAGTRQAAILLGELDLAEPRVLARGEAPRYSRDGQWIAYLSRASGNADVWIMRADGSRKRAVTRSVWEELSPAPSPDGRYVVYSSVRASLRTASEEGRGREANRAEEESHLYLARVEDGYEIQLTQNSQNGRPVW